MYIVANQHMGNLILMRAEGAEELFLLNQTETIVGSDSSCDIVITGLRVSKRHTHIVYQDRDYHKGRYTIADLGSARGTFVNDQRLKEGDEPRELHTDDRIRLGNAVLRFELDTLLRSSSASIDTLDESRESDDADPHAELLETLQSTNLFEDLDANLLRELTSELTVVTLAPGEVLMQQGDTGDAMYVVLQGRLWVEIEDETGALHFRRMVGIHETIGEISLLTGQTRTATVTADDEVKVAMLTSTSFEKLTSTSPAVANALAEAITALIRDRQLRTALNASTLFREMDSELRQACEDKLELIALRGGERLFQQGDPGDGMYIVVSGRVQVVLENTQNDGVLENTQNDGVLENTDNDTAVADNGESIHILRELGRGESLGEIALLTNESRTASVYAIRDTELAKLSRESYEDLASRFPLARHAKLHPTHHQVGGQPRSSPASPYGHTAVSGLDSRPSPGFVDGVCATVGPRFLALRTNPPPQ